jgi:hypothetical protein
VVRLIYADWLDDHGKPGRAEFIRTQCAAQGADSWRTVSNHYADGLPEFTGHVNWRRGFVEHVELPLADYMTHAAALFSLAPILSVRLTDREPDHVERDPGFDPWTWCVFQPTREPCMLPEVLRKHCRGWFPTATDAYADLSAACVAYGRELAGLSPLSELVSR